MGCQDHKQRSSQKTAHMCVCVCFKNESYTKNESLKTDLEL